ncbi:MAG TPA: hypothetical protein VIZ28_16165 [Chitinophagaceae bacterium]
MKKDTIVQFVCFVTNLHSDEFAPLWDRYAKRLSNKKTESALQEHMPETKSKFRYISQHEWTDRDFHFTFMNERRSEHFPEHNVKVVQAGGYLPLEVKRKYTEKDGEVRLIAFISHDENDLDFYRGLPLYKHLNIHQAFYESCTYGYVMEFFVPEDDADELVRHLKQRHGVETGIYKECLAAHV